MSSMYIDLKDLPNWAKEILKEKHMQPRSVPVTVGVEVNISSHDMTKLYLYNGSEVTELKGAITANPWATHVENAIAIGGKVTLPRPECMILEIFHIWGRAYSELYTHPGGILEALTALDELAAVQKAILLGARMYKSSYGGIKDYRYHEIGGRFNITKQLWADTKADLIKTGHLNKRGAITTKGLNAVLGLSLHTLVELLEKEGGQNE